ncbi:hypothetical protein ACVMAJ_001720 [Bradyrhizobium sp. USDA 4448]
MRLRHIADQSSLFGVPEPGSDQEKPRFVRASGRHSRQYPYIFRSRCRDHAGIPQALAMLWDMSWRCRIRIEWPQRIGKGAWIHETSISILDLIVNMWIPRLPIAAKDACIPHGPDELACGHWIADLHMPGIGVEDLMKEAVPTRSDRHGRLV